MKTLLFCSLVTLFAGCAGMPPVPPADAPVQHCMVCRHDRDFACLQVERKPGTPQADHGGRTYYFCSERCRGEFTRHPQRYTVGGR